MSDSRKRHRVIRFFRLILILGDDTYSLVPTHPTAARGKKAFRLRKQTGDRNTYTVVQTDHGPTCQCRGFRRWGHCKHVRALQAARLLD